MKKIIAFLHQLYNLFLIAGSVFFDKNWYLKKNPDVENVGANPLLHYLKHGGFEGRDPGPKFDSGWYLDTYRDVKESGLNPLIHYLRYGKKEGRLEEKFFSKFLYECPACEKKVDEFIPLPSFYIENNEKYGYPYTVDDVEMINVEQYSCPHCGASDRDRLYAYYLKDRLPRRTKVKTLLLDIAPSPSLSQFIERFEKVDHTTADLFMEGVDLSIDIMNMFEVESNFYDVLICSHVLEHVNDDKKALAELYRVLKPGGWGIVMVPIIHTIDEIDEDPTITDPAERWRRFGQDDHVRLYSKKGFVERVMTAGFSLKQLGTEYFGKNNFEKFGITSKSVLYVVEKAL